jgi:hypothetical protein
MRAVLAGAMIFLAAGCTDMIAENRVRSALIDAGLSERDADCMARRMVDRLSIAQLRKLEALKGQTNSLAEFLAGVERIGDAEAIAVTASSAALCTTGIAR